MPYIPDVSDKDTMAAALAYAAAGWYVGPLVNGSKHPGSRLGNDWQHKTSRDPETVVAWFAGTDDGIFLHCGRSGAVVFDVDSPEKLEGVLLDAIGECKPPIQSTRADRPGRGHYLFAQPPGRMIGNGTGKLGGSWGQVRGKNGVIVAEPTEHELAAEGGRYTWTRTGPVPVLPEPVAELLHDAGEGQDAASDDEVRSFLDEHGAADRPELLDAWLTVFTTKVAEGESRHDSMVSVCAGAMSEARAGYFPAREAMDRLETVFLDAVQRPGAGGKQGPARGPGMAQSEWMGISAWAVGQARAADLDEVHKRVAEKMPDGDDLSWIPDDVDPGTGEVRESKYPRIDVTNEPGAIEDITKVIRANKTLPDQYTREGRLVWLEDVEPDNGETLVDKVTVTEMREARLRRLLAEHTLCYKVKKVEKEWIEVPALPGVAACSAILAGTEWGEVQPLRGVAYTPVLRPDGTVLQDPGYDVGTGIYLKTSLTMPPVPDRPTDADAAAAKQLLLDQVLVDFPWIAPADRANFVALLMTPLMRPYVRGLSPLGAITAPERGSGKSLLADVIRYTYGGTMRALSESDEETRKAITGMLRGTSPVLIFDNVPAQSTIEQPSLAMALTNPVWSDRLLGVNEELVLPNDRLWLATGTNIQIGGDFGQRTVLVRIDPRMPNPDRRGGFALDPLEEWVQNNRGRLLHALLVLARSWVAAGAPRADRIRMRSFTPWATAHGGLLAFHGIDGFLGNRDDIEIHDEDGEIWTILLSAWHTGYGDREMRVTDLRADAEVEVAAGVGQWGEAFPKNTRDDKLVSVKAFGSMLRERNGRFYGQHRLAGRYDSDRKTWLWRVTPYDGGQDPLDTSGVTGEAASK